MIYLQLYLEFFKIGLFSIGGGLATLPFLQELITKYGWITKKQLLDMIAISESTPGAIGVNTATFVGINTVNIFGGIIATLGLVTPSIIIIIILSRYFIKFNEHPLVNAGFVGIRAAVVGLIASVAFNLGIGELFNLNASINLTNLLQMINFKAVLLFAILLFLIFKFNKHPIVYLLGAAIIGIIFKF